MPGPIAQAGQSIHQHRTCVTHTLRFWKNLSWTNMRCCFRKCPRVIWKFYPHSHSHSILVLLKYGINVDDSGSKRTQRIVKVDLCERQLCLGSSFLLWYLRRQMSMSHMLEHLPAMESTRTEFPACTTGLASFSFLQASGKRTSISLAHSAFQIILK